MPSLNSIIPFGEITAFAANHSLDDPALPDKPVSLRLPTQSKDLPLAGPVPGSFTLSADEQASVAIINQATDSDSAGYFNLEKSAGAASETGEDTPALEPPATFDPSLAYVVLTGLRITNKLGGSFAVGSAGQLGLDSGAMLENGACVCFPRNTLVWDALKTSLQGFKTVFSADELKGLAMWGPGQATPSQILSCGFQGALTLSFTLTASSVAGTVAAAVNAVLNRAAPFSFSLSASAQLGVSVAASDGFRIFAYRAAPGAILFSVKKDGAVTLGLSATAGVELDFSETDLNGIVTAAFAQAAGVGESVLEDLLAAVTPTPDQTSTIASIVQRLGLMDKVTSGIATLKQKWSDLRDAIIARLTLSVTAQFSYTWQRLTSESLVAQFSVPDNQIAPYHLDILALNLDALRNKGATDGIVFTRLLGQAKTQFDLGFGFTFGVAGYTFLKSWDSLQNKFVEQQRLTAGGDWSKQFAFLGKRAYESSWFERSLTNYIDLDAAMASPMTTPPALTDFKLGLSVAFTWKGYAFKTILDALADYGCVVTAFDTDDVVAARQSLLNAGLNPDATGDAVVSLSVDDAALRALLTVLSGPNYAAALAPRALARALSFTSDYPERSHVDRRTQVYSQVFADFLRMEDPDGDAISRLCRSDLPQVTAGGSVSPVLVNQEELSKMNSWTAQGTIAMSDAQSLQDAMNQEIPDCFKLLGSATGDFTKVFPQAVSNFSTLAAQSYGCRVFASLLVLGAALTPGGLSLLSRSVQLSWTDGGQRRTIVVKPKGS